LVKKSAGTGEVARLGGTVGGGGGGGGGGGAAGGGMGRAGVEGGNLCVQRRGPGWVIPRVRGPQCGVNPKRKHEQTDKEKQKGKEG